MKFAITLIFLLGTFLSFAQAPTSDFSASPLAVCIGDPINFTDLSTAGGAAISGWAWDFGDGNSSSTQNTSHTYAAAGTYTVTLVVTATDGQADAEVKILYVTVHPLPIAGFTTLGNGCTVPFDVTFTNTSDTGAGITYAWDFGNTQTSALENPAAVTYSTAGTFTVVLVVTNTITGCINSFSQNIVVSDFSASMVAPITACVGTPVSFADASTVGSNSWAWTFGDGGSSAQQNPTYTYSAPGTYTITLNAQNTTSGCSDVVTQSITINPLPVPTFTADITVGCAPLGVNFTNTSGAGTFVWDFGNGNTFNGTNPATEIYTANGLHTVTLTMTDANGCVGITTIVDMIDISTPIAAFTFDQFEGCEPLIVTFTDASTEPDPIGDPIVTWLWDFGDGSPIFSGQFPPAHNYNVGLYTVTLTVFTSNGCQGTIAMTELIQVGSIINVNFSVAPTIECAKSPVDFTDLTTFNGIPNAGEVIYSWDFGDGGTGSDQNPTWLYPTDTGFFDVQLIVEWRGCIDSFTMTNAVYILAPISIFTPDNLLFCNPSSLPITVNITDQAILGVIPDDVFMTYTWGDGTFTNFDDPAPLDGPTQGNTSHQYGAYGSYTVQQAVYNYTTGCSDSTTQTIHVSQTDASFTLSNDSICVGDPVLMTSTSTSSHPFGTYVYDMGDGGSVSGDPIAYSYSSFGAYDVQLVATNSVGCPDTSTFIGLDALALPSAVISPSATDGCAPINVIYTNNSVVVGNGVPLAAFDWIFADGSTQTTTNLATSTNYSYTTEGNFPTTLTVTDQFGCVSPAAVVNINITKPSASFTMDSVVCDLEIFTAMNGSSGASSYEWFIDGNSASFASDFTTSFNETTSPTSNFVLHNFVLIATDAFGCTDTVSQDLIVSMPRVDISYTLTGASVNAAGEFTCPPVFASFTDNTDSYGSIDNWAWDFGDGKFSTLQDPDNTYVFSGTYSASLTITDEFGCTSDTSLLDYLTIFGPSADPQWSSAGDICGQTFTFSAANQVNVNNIQWVLGDGTTVFSTDPFDHSYLPNSTYTPTVIISDSLGCEVIMPLPQITVIDNGMNAFFAASPSEGTIGTLFVLDEASTSTALPIDTWTWYFLGDTLTSFTGDDIIQNFGLPGTYPITLLIEDANGCYDTYSSQVIVTNDFHPPNVFTPNGDGVNEYFSLEFPIFESFNIVILNRWGNVVHQRDGATGVELWDGLTQGGLSVADGVYFYRLHGVLVDGTSSEKHGNVTVFSGPQ
ncbi:MAG: gliding motility-associated-like protein [Flavobacteriaceae bacterium]|jgi:gliding motility-associated-like protein